MIASVLGVIPGVGMLLHWAACICLLVDGILTLAKGKKKAEPVA